ncbi:MAG: SlyX family protein [Planctomycetota bacterium]|nr:SlyX family protein [Planctomycetota bacterium]MDA1249839.1 SlyX family protein [Planctomycetota bacterium]
MTDSEQHPRNELIAVQETLMHQQRDLQQMHEVLLAQQNEIEGLRKELAQLRGDVQTQLGEDRLPSPDDEKPPHY